MQSNSLTELPVVAAHGTSGNVADIHNINGDSRLSTRCFFRFAWEQSEVRIKVVGSAPALGEWDPENGIELHTNFEFFPCWISQDPVILPLGERVEYNYVILDKNDDSKVLQWASNTKLTVVSGLGPQQELFIDNHATYNVLEIVPSGVEMTVEDDGGLFRGFSGKTAEDIQHVEEKQNFDLEDQEETQEELETRIMNRLNGIDPANQDPESMTIKANDTVLIVAFQLPLRVTKTEEGNWAVTTSKNNIIPYLHQLRRVHQVRVLCVGWPGIHVHTEYEKRQIADLLIEYDCVPVFPPRVEFEKFCKFCNQMLWPIFHDVMLFLTNNKVF